MKKLTILTFSICFLLVNSSYSHDPKNCDVLENYDFSQFDNWKMEVIKNAPQYDLDKNFVKTLVQDYQVNKRVIENDKCQPEFTLTFSEYIDKRISKLRIKNGINKYNENNVLLQNIKQVYNVQPRFIVSIWGLETAYGEITGNYPVIESLLTMSYDERRRSYFTKELFNSFKIIEEGHIDLENFKGSWAGAMGQNQFMPSSFLNYAQDFNNDGKKNIWTDFLEVNINNLAAVPSIIYGLLGLAIFINFFGFPRSAPIVGGLVLSLMTFPVVIIASRAALKSVPPSIRDAALGLGASKIQTTLHHVVPLALPGMLTGSIVGMARALGESAPLIMIGMVAFVVDIPSSITEPSAALPVQVFLWSDAPERGFAEKTSAAIMVLLVFLLLMNSLAIWLRNKFQIKW